MTSMLTTHLRPAVAVLLALTLLTGVAYPAAVTAIAQVAFPAQANGSLLVLADGRAVGSALLGQAFDDPRYLWGRPSAAGEGYDGMASAGSNLGPTSQTLVDRVTADVDRYRAEHGDAPVPVDLVTTSASGLDPDISPGAAAYQAARIAVAGGIPVADAEAAIARHTEGRLFGFLGQPTVRVLLVNLDLDGLLG
jgi:K+-transporting ATPase ATPase C chain